MFDKQMEKKLREALTQIDSSKLAKVKEKLENSGDLSTMLNNLDIQKAQKTLEELNLNEEVRSNDLTNLIDTLKKNPDVIRQLKKNL